MRFFQFLLKHYPEKNYFAILPARFFHFLPENYDDFSIWTYVDAIISGQRDYFPRCDAINIRNSAGVPLRNFASL